MTAPLKLTPFDAFVDADGRPESRRLKELRAYWEKKCDRRAAPARRSVNTGRLYNSWLAALLIVVFVTTSLAPSFNVARATPALTTLDDNAAPPEAEYSATSRTDPSRNGCDDDRMKACEDTVLCMAVCGKLPVQLSAENCFSLSWVSDEPANRPVTDRPGLSPPPLRRPPRSV